MEHHHTSELILRLQTAVYLVLVTALGLTSPWLFWPIVCAGAVQCVTEWVRAIGHRRRRWAWMCAGTLYIGMGAASLLWLYTEWSRWTMLWFFVLVWTADSAKYLLAYWKWRLIVQSPGISPHINPKKTWAGVYASVVLTIIIGLTLAWSILRPNWLPGTTLTLTMLTALAVNTGDLAASASKRLLGVRDFGKLLPGHGGLLDRYDGCLLAAIGCAIAWFSL